MENSGVLSDMEVNKDPQESDSSEGLDDPLTLSQLLQAVPSFGGGDLDWPLPFPFTTWEEALGLENLLEFHQSTEPDWEAFAASIACANYNEALLPQVNMRFLYLLPRCSNSGFSERSFISTRSDTLTIPSSRLVCGDGFSSRLERSSTSSSS